MEEKQIILQNPKQSRFISIEPKLKDALITKSWRKRIFEYYRSLIPSHIKDNQQLWLSTPEKIVEFIKNLRDPHFDLFQKEYICIFDTISDIYDIIDFLTQLRDRLPEHARIIYSNYNWKWYPLFTAAARLKISRRRPFGNFYKDADLDCFTEMSGWENIRKIHRFFFPFKLFGILNYFESFFARLPFFRLFTLNTIFIARKKASASSVDSSVTILIPCKNEEGNIEAVINRTPFFGKSIQLLFINDKSTDSTEKIILQYQALLPEKNICLAQGKGIGKGEAIHEGIKKATGDICIILDADLTVIPEDLPQFYNAINSRTADFITGTRFVYPQCEKAMRPANLLGNIAFSFIFSFIIGQRITDTLCGTKVFWRKDWQIFEEMKYKLKNSDVWGDYNLIFSSAYYGLKIGQLPVRYFERLEGATKMNKRLKNGLVMLKVIWHAFLCFFN